MRSCVRPALVALLTLAVAASVVVRAQSHAEALLTEASGREAALRKEIDSRKAGAPATPLLERARTLTQTYDDLARLFPKAETSDDALWRGGMLAADAYWEFGEPQDRATALRVFQALATRYPTSTLLKQASAQTVRLSGARPEGPAPVTAAVLPPAAAKPLAPAIVSARAPAVPTAMLKAIRREVLPETLRVTLELERETTYQEERIDGPPRVFIDLQNTRAVDALKDATLTFPDDVVKQIRIGRQQDARTRVVLDLSGAQRHSVYALYSPYRVVIDFERPVATTKAAAVPTTPKDTANAKDAKSTKDTKEAAVAAPAAAAANTNGNFSLSRQLGLGVARVVIDPGHGGHDPGAKVKTLSESELTLDIALRLEKLLLKQPGVEVVLTRRSNAYVPLEERTAIANRAEADLFLSIHANASGDQRARGVETYFLNFASNPAAEAVAARENAGSSRTMRELPDIVKAIALNNKIDESRDFAAFVQGAMFERLRRSNRTIRNLGVKQAPFVVLIGATMPSVLAEISFLSNTQEAALLRTGRYRDQIAEALSNGVMTYQKSLKSSPSVATR